MADVPPRRRPYPEAKLYTMKCHCCATPARFQWNACADGNVWRPLCPECDVKINVEVMKVLDPVNWRKRIRAYCKDIGFKIPKEMLK